MSVNKIVYFFLISLTSCQVNNKEDKVVSSMNQAKRDVTEIKNEVRQGNIKSYQELRIVYLDYPSESFLFWSLLMANKYDYPRAYLDVYYCLVNSYGDIEKFEEMDGKTKKMALDYLTIASEKEIKEATEILRLHSEHSAIKPPQH